MAKTKVTLALTDEALALLSANATGRKRGEVTSTALIHFFNPKPVERKSSVEGGLLERVEKLLEKVAAKL